MGVKRLSSFVRSLNIHDKYLLSDTTVVIDGNNFLYWLHRKHDIEFKYGGNYDQSYFVGIRYMEMFEECNVKPIIVFDGGMEDHEWRFQKACKRANDKISHAIGIENGSCTELLLPNLSWESFQEVLDKKQIKYVRCVYDADSHIAALANYFQCPVISGDSDFFILDVKFGVITLDSMPKIGIQTGLKHIVCEIFHRHRFLSHFPGLNSKILPLFATLMGNDVIDENFFDTFFYRINGLHCHYSEKTRLLLNWLKYKSIEDVIPKILQAFQTEDHNKVKERIEQSIHEYNNGNIQLARFLEDGTSATEESVKDAQIYTPSKIQLPEWFIKMIFKCDITPFFLDVIMLRKIILPIQPQDEESDSVNQCSLPLRKVLYGICLSFEKEQNEDSFICSGITEYDRHGRYLCSTMVSPTFDIPQYGPVPSLNNIQSMDKKQRFAFFLAAIGIKSAEFLEEFPESWRLFSVVVVYWMKRSCPSDTFLNSLVSCAIIHSFVKPISHSPVSKNDFVEEGSGTLGKIINKISKAEARLVEQRCQRYSFKPADTWIGSYFVESDRKIIHSYSQFQSCFSTIINLSQILKMYSDFSILRCLNGRFLFSLTKELNSTASISELFGGGYVRRLFIEIKTRYNTAASLAE